MTYALLGHTLHETADRAKKYFVKSYGATSFACESEVEKDLPLRPTWQADLKAGYRLCVEVRETPFSPTLYQFVTVCANRNIPVRLWVAVPAGAAPSSFGKELREARELGVGVVEIAEDGTAHEFHRPVPLSLFGLRKTDLNKVPKQHRESIKKAEDTFLDGAPEQGCQAVCQELESLTRKFAEYTYDQIDWWKNKATLKIPKRFFTTESWAKMLAKLDQEIDEAKVRGKAKEFKVPLIAGARQYTDWRNSVSHKPKTLKDIQARDAKLRTMFEASRDLVIDWYKVALALKLKV